MTTREFNFVVTAVVDEHNNKQWYINYERAEVFFQDYSVYEYDGDNVTMRNPEHEEEYIFSSLCHALQDAINGIPERIAVGANVLTNYGNSVYVSFGEYDDIAGTDTFGVPDNVIAFYMDKPYKMIGTVLWENEEIVSVNYYNYMLVNTRKVNAK